MVLHPFQVGNGRGGGLEGGGWNICFDFAFGSQ